MSQMTPQQMRSALLDEMEAVAKRKGWEVAGPDHPVYQDKSITMRSVHGHPDRRRSVEEKKKEAIIAAVREGDVAKVESLLERRFLNCICDNRDYSPLMCAIENGHESLVEFLLGAGASPNVPGYRDATRVQKLCPLELAVEGGNDNIRRQIASSANCLLPVNREYLCRPTKPVRYILPEPRRGDGSNPRE